KNPVLGTFKFDGSEFDDYAVDVPPGGCQGMQPTREGFPEVCKELLANQAEERRGGRRRERRAGSAVQACSDLVEIPPGSSLASIREINAKPQGRQAA